ncbi:hypothetical protein [Flavobacterium sp.]|uniref:hypothetical protein n=1 Tax=Flavobacterium sp. TaxID=239 RepID=UPI0039189A8F
MEIIKSLYWFGGVFIFGIVIIMGFALPHTLRIFRLPRMYKRALIISIVLLVIGIVLQFDDSFDCLERRNLFYPVYGILYLLLYKISDNFILKKKGRNMYYLTMWQLKDEESGKSTNIENLIQYANFIICLCTSYYGSMLIIKSLYSC